MRSLHNEVSLPHLLQLCVCALIWVQCTFLYVLHTVYILIHVTSMIHSCQTSRKYVESELLTEAAGRRGCGVPCGLLHKGVRAGVRRGLYHETLTLRFYDRPIADIRLWYMCPCRCEIPDPAAINIILAPGLAFGTGMWGAGLLGCSIGPAPPHTDLKGGGEGDRQTDRHCVQQGRAGTYDHSDCSDCVLIAQESTQPRGSASMQFMTSCKGESQ